MAGRTGWGPGWDTGWGTGWDPTSCDTTGWQTTGWDPDRVDSDYDRRPFWYWWSPDPCWVSCDRCGWRDWKVGVPPWLRLSDLAVLNLCDWCDSPFEPLTCYWCRAFGHDVCLPDDLSHPLCVQCTKKFDDKNDGRPHRPHAVERMAIAIVENRLHPSFETFPEEILWQISECLVSKLQP